MRIFLKNSWGCLNSCRHPDSCGACWEANREENHAYKWKKHQGTCHKSKLFGSIYITLLKFDEHICTVCLHALPGGTGKKAYGLRETSYPAWISVSFEQSLKKWKCETLTPLKLTEVSWND